MARRPCFVRRMASPSAAPLPAVRKVKQSRAMPYTMKQTLSRGSPVYVQRSGYNCAGACTQTTLLPAGDAIIASLIFSGKRSSEISYNARYFNQHASEWTQSRAGTARPRRRSLWQSGTLRQGIRKSCPAQKPIGAGSLQRTERLLLDPVQSSLNKRLMPTAVLAQSVNPLDCLIAAAPAAVSD